jgi:peptidoglycan-associated lipoprotein
MEEEEIMMHARTRSVMVPALAALLAMVVVAGCAKKTSPPDVTGTTEGQPPPGSTGDATTPGDGGTTQTPSGDEQNQGLKDAYFSYDDYALSSDARSVLAGNAAVLKEMRGLRVVIEGHCDERGTVEYNLALGQRRADAARSYLADLGIDAGRLSTISYGKERPFAPGHDESAWSQNRRAHFRVTNP